MLPGTAAPKTWIDQQCCSSALALHPIILRVFGMSLPPAMPICCFIVTPTQHISGCAVHMVNNSSMAQNQTLWHLQFGTHACSSGVRPNACTQSSNSGANVCASRLECQAAEDICHGTPFCTGWTDFSRRRMPKGTEGVQRRGDTAMVKLHACGACSYGP